MKKVRIFLQYAAAFFAILLLIFLIASTVLVKFYGDELKAYTMEILNDQLDTKVSIGEVGISVLKKFPNTSVYLNDVMVWSGHTFEREQFSPAGRDTLLHADRAYLQFNMLKLIRKNFQIKGLEFHEGVINILIDEAGNSNYNVAANKTDEKGSGTIDIKGFIARNISLQYINHAKNLHANGDVLKLTLDGNFAADEYGLEGEVDAYVIHVTNHDITYASNQGVYSSVSLQVKQNQFIIDKGNLNLGDLTTTVSGSFLVDKDTGTDLNLEITGRRIDLSWISEILQSSIESEELMSAKGKADLDIEISGLATTTLNPHIKARFSTSNAQFASGFIPMPVKSISLSGNYTNGTFNTLSSSAITLDAFQAGFGKSHIEGKLKIVNLLEPSFNTNITGNIEARDLSTMLPELPVDFREGTITPAIKLDGTLRKQDNKTRINKLNPSGTIMLKDLTLFPLKGDFMLKDISGETRIAGQKIDVLISGWADNSDFKGVFSMNNPLVSANNSDKLKITGTLESSSVDIDAILHSLKSGDEGSENKNPPENLYMDIDFSFQQITKGTIQTRKVNGNFIFDYPAIYIDPVYLETMNGAINAGISITDLHLDLWKMQLDANYRNVEIKDVFTSFNNFNQEFITDKQIAGKISGETQFLADVEPGFKIPASSIISENTFIIENGELNNFQPLIELSRFLKIDRMDEVKFSTIRNTILIDDNSITIPRMDIQSSAFNLEASGNHSFEKTFEYHVATKLSEILFKKAKNSRNEEFNIALDKDDKRTLFLLIYDKGEGVMVDFDEDQAMKKIRQDMKEERIELKSILNEEFGIFNKDREVQEEKQENEKPVMQFQFDDEKTNDTLQDQNQEKPRWWKRNRKQDKKPEFEFVIDDK